MRQVMVRYTVRPDAADENIRLIENVFESLAQERPQGLSYSTYRLDDGVTFVHIATIADETHNPLQALPAFKAFTANVKDRCTIAPVTTKFEQVGAYRHDEVPAA